MTYARARAVASSRIYICAEAQAVDRVEARSPRSVTCHSDYSCSSIPFCKDVSEDSRPQTDGLYPRLGPHGRNDEYFGQEVGDG